ncbi:MAG: membrane protein insertion efficiency factor YidD [Candidatus Gracilibacteria bacterium]
MLKFIIETIWKLPRNAMILLVRVYQKTLSPDHGVIFKQMYPYGYCKYHPTCSEYGCQAFEKKGFVKGMLLTIWRILRCNPFSKGGEDPVK